MRQKNTIKNRGFTLVELMVAFLIGSVVLAALMSFFFKSSKMIANQQTEIKDLSQLQLVIAKVASIIKTANSESPKINTNVSTVAWATVPHLPYTTQFYNDPETNWFDTTVARIMPNYPVAYNFNSQGDLKISETSGDWYPSPSSTSESNALVFYRMKRGSDKKTISPSEVERVWLYTEIDNNEKHPLRKNLVNLVMERQWDMLNVGYTEFNASHYILNGDKTTILRNVKSVQFSYPLLEKAIDDATTGLKTYLLANPTDVYSQNTRMQPYRDTIKIRVVTPGRVIGDRLTDGLDLSTEVKIRN